MTIYVVANTKGGVGKTTLALNIGVALAKMGRDVAMVNGDRQLTLSIAINNRAAHADVPQLFCPHYPDGAQLRQQVQLMRSKYQDIVIDVGGRDSTSLRAALMLADVVLVPFQPRSFDVWAVDEIQALVEEAMGMRDPCHLYAVLNLADPGNRSTDNQDAASMIQATPFHFLDITVVRRKSFADAAGQGLAVTEAERRDPKATVELDMLMDRLVKLASTPATAWKDYKTPAAAPAPVAAV